VIRSKDIPARLLSRLQDWNDKRPVRAKGIQKAHKMNKWEAAKGEGLDG